MKKQIHNRLIIATVAVLAVALTAVAVACEDELAEGEYRPGVERPDIPGGYQPRDTVADTTAHQEDTTLHGGIDYSQYDPISRYADSTLNAWLDSVLEGRSNWCNDTIILINDRESFLANIGVEPTFDFTDISVVFGKLGIPTLHCPIRSQDLYNIHDRYYYHIIIAHPTSGYESMGSIRYGAIYHHIPDNTNIILDTKWIEE